MDHPRFPHFAQALRERRRFLLMSPDGPDGDSLGSILALRHHLTAQGKDATCYAPEPPSSTFDFLPGIESLVTDPAAVDVGAYDCLVFCDGGDVKRTGLAGAIAARDRQRTIFVNVDHHPSRLTVNGEDVCDINVQTLNVSSASELLHHFFQSIEATITKEIATCLLTGILTDTGSFQNLATTPTSLAAAATLCNRGANIAHIGARTMKNKSLNELQLWGRALGRLTKDSSTGLVSTIITDRDLTECGVDEEATEGIANFLNTLDDATATLLLRQKGELVKGSLRSTKAGVDVSRLAAAFGGGGHAKAAGFSFPGRLVETHEGWRIQPSASGGKMST